MKFKKIIKYKGSCPINENETKKEYIRGIKGMFLLMSPHRSGLILSLPYIYFRFERMVNSWISNKYTYECFEKEENLIHKMKENKIKFNIKNVNINFLELVDYIKNVAKKDSFVFADLDGMSELVSLEETFRIAIEKKIIKINCAMCLTIANRNNGDYFTKTILNSNPNNEENKISNSQHVFKVWLKGIIKDDYSIEFFESYNNSEYDSSGKRIKKGHDMITAIIVRIK